MFAWMAAQKDFAAHVQSKEDTSDEPVLPCEIFRPSCSSNLQAIIFRKNSSGILTHHVGLVFAVYRGSVSRVKGSPRKLKVSKCLGMNAPAEAVARIMVLQMKPLQGAKHSMCTSLLEPAHILVPAEDVLGELPLEESGERNGIFYCSLRESSLQVFEQICQGKLDTSQLFDDKKKVVAAKEPAVDETTVGFGCADFGKGASGRKNIQIFMEKLPAAYKKHGVNLLDANGGFKVHGKVHTWSSLCSRATLFFELTQDKSESKMGALAFSSAVYYRLAPFFGRSFIIFYNLTFILFFLICEMFLILLNFLLDT